MFPNHSTTPKSVPGPGIGKKYPVSFFLRALAVRLTNYIIRNISIYSNMTSCLSLASLVASSRCFASLAYPVTWLLLKFYALEVILDTFRE
jgi:hypothetical protein